MGPEGIDGKNRLKFPVLPRRRVGWGPGRDIPITNGEVRRLAPLRGAVPV